MKIFALLFPACLSLIFSGSALFSQAPAFPSPDIQSKESLRFRGVSEQRYDTSCAFASVATLLSLYWGIEAREKGLLKQFFGALDKKNPEKEYTINMLQLRQLIQERGLEAAGFKMNAQQLAQVSGRYAPILVHYQKPTEHFALLLGTIDAYFVMADPARGIEILSERQLERRRDALVLLVASSSKYRRRGTYLEEVLRRGEQKIVILNRMAK